MLQNTNISNQLYLIQSTGPSEDDVRIVHLDDSLAQPHQVSANSNGTAGHLKEGQAKQLRN